MRTYVRAHYAHTRVRVRIKQGARLAVALAPAPVNALFFVSFQLIEAYQTPANKHQHGV